MKQLSTTGESEKEKKNFKLHMFFTHCLQLDVKLIFDETIITTIHN